MHIQSGAHRKETGIVYKKTIGMYLINVDGRKVTCELSPRLRKELVYPTADPSSLSHIVVAVREVDVVDPVAVGDVVTFVDNEDGTGLIVEVQDRKSRFARRSAVSQPGKHAREQVIVANVDQVVPVMAAAQPVPKWNLLDRYLASAESLDLPSLVVITKTDLVRDGSDLDMEAAYLRKIGYQVILTSVVNGRGIDEVRQALRGKLSVLVGKSGVGKSSLLNAIQPGLGLRVNEVNRVTGKGKHTTTHLETVSLDFGGAVVDTPGMREFGLWDVGQHDLGLFFPEMRPHIGKCKFGLDCAHESEPGCTIRKAVEAGEISERRYESFLRMKEEL